MSGQKLIKTPNTLNIIHTFENRQEFQQVQFCFPLCVVEDWLFNAEHGFDSLEKSQEFQEVQVNFFSPTTHPLQDY